MKVLTDERYQFILAFLEKNQTITIHEIKQSIGSSDSTIRRDLQVLEDRGLLIRVHGGAKKKQQLNYEASMAEKKERYQQEKKAIAKFAAKLIQPNDIIYLDAGSTTLEMIPLLPKNLSLTVVTNSITHAILLLDEQIPTIILGGTLKESTNAILGSSALKQLQQFYFDKAFIGTNGIDTRAGFTTPDPEEAFLKQTAASHSQKTYVLADHSKFKERSFTQIFPLSNGQIITDYCPKDEKEKIQKMTKMTEVLK